MPSVTQADPTLGSLRPARRDTVQASLRLNVYAATPSALLLVPPVVKLLRDALADLPATPP